MGRTLPVFQHQPGVGWQDVSGLVPVHLPAASYSVFSYNVWFQGFQNTRNEQYRQQAWLPRQRALLQEARSADADFLCFQEVTAPSHQGLDSFLELLQQQDWVQREYYLSDLSGEASFNGWYGVVIATRIPIREFKVLDLPTQLGRNLVVAHVNTPAGSEEIAVGTSHLESPVNAQSNRYRVQQLEATMEYFSSVGVTTGIIMGDFNVTDDRSIATVCEAHGWTDLNDGSTTWFSQEQYAGWRPDRIMVRSSHYECCSPGGVAQVCADSAWGGHELGSDGVVMTPSDHYALLARFARREDAPVLELLEQQSDEPLSPVLVNDLVRVHSEHGHHSEHSHDSANGSWSVTQTQLAISPEDPLILQTSMTVTQAVKALNAGCEWHAAKCYVYSEYKQKWYMLWRDQSGGWSLQQSREACVVEPRFVFVRSNYVSEAVEMLNAGGWAHDVCFVYSNHCQSWYKLWCS